MNAISKLVKEAMLSYPGLFPTRFDAQMEIWSTSNYCWKNGELVRAYADDRSVTVMDYSDLDEQEKRLNEDKSYELEILADLFVQNMNELKIERMERQMREANIDLYASTDINPRYAGGRIAEAFPAYNRRGPSPAPLFCVPENVTPEFRQAALEFIDLIRPSVHNQSTLCDALDANKRLIFGAAAYDEMMDELTARSKRLIGEVIAEEKAAQ